MSLNKIIWIVEHSPRADNEFEQNHTDTRTPHEGRSIGDTMKEHLGMNAKKILVVDDEPDILEFLQVILEEEGYLVATTEKGEYVEKLHAGGLPDLILLDVLLSGKDGREIVKQLKSQEETKSIPIIMFSAHPSAEKTAREAGADDFVAKPFHIDFLLAVVAKYL